MGIPEEIIPQNSDTNKQKGRADPCAASPKKGASNA